MLAVLNSSPAKTTSKPRVYCEWLSVADPAYRRGTQFLLKTQLADGSWFVQSRSLPVQAYFESGFPHGRSQFISCAATSWATMALGLTAAPLER